MGESIDGSLCNEQLFPGPDGTMHLSQLGYEPAKSAPFMQSKDSPIPYETKATSHKREKAGHILQNVHQSLPFRGRTNCRSNSGGLTAA
jgi:hypothetical protein